MPSFLRCFVFLFCLFFSAPVLQAAPRSLAQWEKFDFAKGRISLAQIRPLPLGDAKKLRGLVFGRHGRVFDDKEIQNYLKSRAWYKPNPKYKSSRLNANEIANVDVIREAEWLRHKRVVPGDMKFYRNRALTLAQVGKPSLAELRIMRAEIDAIHGATFEDAPWLRMFFNERYWYHPGDETFRFTAIELKNYRLLYALEKRMRGTALAPGDMDFYQTQPLRTAQLRGLSLYEMRLLRNEIYARRGRRFRTDWIADHFDGKDWYKPFSDFREPKLSVMEQRNLDVIVNYENQIHEDLSRKQLNTALLKDMFLDDVRKLRNEIYARRGRTYKDLWLRGYFQSFAWYKPNPRYRESQLNRIERRNAKLIFDFEKKLAAQLDAVEA